MQYRKPYNYNEFQCIADKCPATCCDGWAIVIDEKTMCKYHTLPGEHRNFVLSHVDVKEGVFRQCGSRCAFLNDRNLCDLYMRLGEAGFCNTCRRYPRHFEEYGNLIEAALSMSCPVAARMIVANPKRDRFVGYCNDKESAHSAEVDPVLLGGLLAARGHMFDIINDRSLSVQYRIKRAYYYSAKVQKLIYNYEKLGHKVKKKKCVAEFLLKMDMLTKKEISFAESMRERKIVLSNENTAGARRQENMRELIDILSVLENINSDWPKLVEELRSSLYINMRDEEYRSLSREFADYMRDRSFEYEHIFNFFIYTYYLGGVYDFNVHAMTKFAVISYAVIRDLGLLTYIKNKKTFSVDDQIKICYTYSRQIEHSDENLVALEGLLNAHPKLSDAKILSQI